MFKQQTLILAIAVSVVLVCNVQAVIIDSNWVGGEERKSWENNSNWNPAVIPNNNGDTYNVTIDGEVNGVTIELNGSLKINQLDCYNEVLLGKWVHDSCFELTLEDPNGLINGRVLRI